jgi:hypothetical protein
MARISIYSKKVFIILLISVLGGSIASCKDKIIKLEMQNRNPIEYIFNISKDSLYKVIVQKQGFMKLSVMTIKNRSIIPVEISALLSQTNNNEDVFLWSIGEYCKSRIYQNKNGEFLSYWVSFYLHLEKIDEYHTKVSIKTIEPRVIIGRECLPKPPHFVRKDKFLAVEPSTIEEYEILLRIGELVGEKNMPQLKLPG